MDIGSQIQQGRDNLSESLSPIGLSINFESLLIVLAVALIASTLIYVLRGGSLITGLGLGLFASFASLTGLGAVVALLIYGHMFFGNLSE